MTDMKTHYPQVTRFEVIDHRTSLDRDQRGLKVHILAADVTLSLQDEGRTLKVFLKDREDGVTEGDVKEVWGEALGDDLKGITEMYLQRQRSQSGQNPAS